MRVLLIDNELKEEHKEIILENINVLFRENINIDLVFSFEDAEYLSFIRDYDFVLLNFKNFYYKKMQGFLYYINKRNKDRHLSSSYINKTKINLIKRNDFLNCNIKSFRNDKESIDNVFTKSDSFITNYLESFFSKTIFLKYELFNFGNITLSEYLVNLANHIEYQYKNISCINDLIIYNKKYVIDINLKYLRKSNALYNLLKLNSDSLIVPLNKKMDFKIFYWLIRHYKEFLSVDNIICGLSPDPESIFNYSIESSFTSIRKNIKNILPSSFQKEFNPIKVSKKIGYQLCF